MFSSLPSDVHNLIYSSLSFKDIGIMHQVSKAQNTTITNSLSEQKRREQIFKDRFGAFASYENTQDIWNRTARRYNRLKKLSQANPTFILKFDVDGMPILVKPTNEPEKTSWRENIKVKYFQ